MFLRGLCDVFFNGNLMEISQRHLTAAGFRITLGKKLKVTVLNPTQDEEQKSPHASFFSPETSPKVIINPQNFLNFSFRPLATLM